MSEADCYLEDISDAEAERRIVGHLKAHEHADTGELMELGIDIDVVLRAVQRLKERGVVERVEPPANPTGA